MRTDSAFVRGAQTRKVVAFGGAGSACDGRSPDGVASIEGTAPSQGCQVTGTNLRTRHVAENALAHLHLPRDFRLRDRNAEAGRAGYGRTMRRARFYLTLLALTLLPQIVAAADLCRYLSDHDVRWLSFSVPGVLFLLNVPMAFEVLRRKRRVRLPRIVAALVQTTWTAFWLGSVFYVILLLFWALGGLIGKPGPMPIWLALAPFALAAYGTLFGARVANASRFPSRVCRAAGGARASCSFPISTRAGTSPRSGCAASRAAPPGCLPTCWS